MTQKQKMQWGGKRACAGRKKTCSKRVSFNRRIDECILNILREYAKEHNLTETEALESAILLQTNISKRQKGGFMKIAIPTKDEKLCGHFGHCDAFTFVDVDTDKNEILKIEEKIPEEGISCQSASWISAQGANVVLAGGIGGRPSGIFEQNGIQVISGCPELPIKEIVMAFLNGSLQTGENTCGKGHHNCHGHGENGHCHH